MKKIAEADIFVYTGEHMEPWAKRLADAASGRNEGGVRIVDASVGAPLLENEDVDAHEHRHEYEHIRHGNSDPHIWLDPTIAALMARTIGDAVIEADPDNASFYRENMETLVRELEELDKTFARTVADSPRRILVFGERFAFAYFFHRYGLEVVSAYKSCAPGAEPGMKAVIDVVDRVRSDGVKYIYREATSTPRISTIIAEETGAEVLLVDSIHNPAASGGASYLDAMRRNMAAFAKGLE